VDVLSPWHGPPRVMALSETLCYVPNVWVLEATGPVNSLSRKIWQFCGQMTEKVLPRTRVCARLGRWVPVRKSRNVTWLWSGYEKLITSPGHSRVPRVSHNPIISSSHMENCLIRASGSVLRPGQENCARRYKIPPYSWEAVGS
jgi:hypothetical protein